MERNHIQYQILYQKIRTGNSTGLDTESPLNMVQRIIFFEKGEWKQPFEHGFISSCHFSSAITRNVLLPLKDQFFPCVSGFYFYFLGLPPCL